MYNTAKLEPSARNSSMSWAYQEGAVIIIITHVCCCCSDCTCGFRHPASQLQLSDMTSTHFASVACANQLYCISTFACDGVAPYLWCSSLEDPEQQGVTASGTELHRSRAVQFYIECSHMSMRRVLMPELKATAYVLQCGCRLLRNRT